MTAIEHLYYGLGHVAYAVAMADGDIQSNELRKVQQIVEEEIQARNHSIDIAQIIFHILDSERMSAETAYKWGIEEMKTGKRELNEEVKERFVKLLRTVADAFAPTTEEEEAFIRRFTQDISEI